LYGMGTRLEGGMSNVCSEQETEHITLGAIHQPKQVGIPLLCSQLLLPLITMWHALFPAHSPSVGKQDFFLLSWCLHLLQMKSICSGIRACYILLWVILQA
jgi:hypothetical protein